MENFFKFVCGGAFFALVAFVFIPLAVDAAEREAKGRAENLCAVYGVCDPKAGP